jgi:hypothetical protein
VRDTDAAVTGVPDVCKISVCVCWYRVWMYAWVWMYACVWMYAAVMSWFCSV